MRALIPLLLALTVAAGAPAGAADLLEVYRAAQSSDAVYAAARATWAAGQEKLPQGRSGLLPSATLSAGTQLNDRDFRPRDPNVGNTTSRFNSNVLSLSITQPLYRPQNLTVYEQAKTQVAQSDAVFAIAAQDLILRVAQAYFDVLLAQNTVELAAAQLSAIGQQLEQAKRNFEVGTATITDTHDAQARYDLTVSGEIAAKNDLEVKKRALSQVIGRTAPPLSTVSTTRFTLVDPEPNNMEAWVKDAFSANLQIVVSQASLDFALQEVERNRAAHRPTVDAFATYSDTGSGIGGVGLSATDTVTKVVGVQLAIPLYQGGLITSRVREALANEEKARQDLENARRSADFVHAPGFPRRHERHRAGEGAGRGADLEPELARFHAARAGSRRENAGRRAERPAAPFPDAPRSRAGRIQLPHVALAAQGGGRQARRGRSRRGQQLADRP